jgi:hypothetical protein
MSAISLVVCTRNQRDLLERLLRNSADCYDDLLVVHDGDDDVDLVKSIEQLVLQHRGRFLVRPRAFQQEAHWPFAWQHAAFDWILRFDADEIPSEPMRQWLLRFRKESEPAADVSGYTCVWPLWNGRREISRHIWTGRTFLFHRERVRYFAMPEQVPIADDRFEPLNLVLNHRPIRKSYGFHNLFVRRQGHRWREQIARNLLGKPTHLSCWRWTNEAWPPQWQEIRRRPLPTMVSRLIIGTLRTLRDQWKAEGRLFPIAAMHGPINHALICFEYWRARRAQRSRE